MDTRRWFSSARGSRREPDVLVAEATGQLRFVCILDPLDLWTVWDEHTGQPAEADVPLIGLDEAAARSACRKLNQRHAFSDLDPRRRCLLG